MMVGGESGNCREHILDRGINFQPFTLFLGHISNPQYYSSTPLEPSRERSTSNPMYRKQERVNTNTPASNILQAGTKNRDSEGNCLSRLGGRQPGAHSGRVTGEDVVHNGC